MLLEQEVISLVYENGKPAGVQLQDGSIIKAPYIIYSGTVWNLYGKLISPAYTTAAKRDWQSANETDLSQRDIICGC